MAGTCSEITVPVIVCFREQYVLMVVALAGLAPAEPDSALILVEVSSLAVLLTMVALFFSNDTIPMLSANDLFCGINVAVRTHS